MRPTDLSMESIIHEMESNQRKSLYGDVCAFTRKGNACDLYACLILRQATSISPHCLRKLFLPASRRLVPSICTDSKTPMARTRNRLPELIGTLDSTRFSTKLRRLARKGDQSPDVSPHGVCMDPGHLFSTSSLRFTLNIYKDSCFRFRNSSLVGSLDSSRFTLLTDRHDVQGTGCTAGDCCHF